MNASGKNTAESQSTVVESRFSMASKISRIPDVNAVLHGDIEDDQQQEPNRGDPRDAVSSFARESAA